MIVLEMKAIIAPVEARLAAIQAKLASPSTYLQALVPAVEPTTAAAQVNAPFHEGDLQGNIRPVITGPMSIAIRTDLPYSWMRERGGVIRAKNAPRLHWFDYGGGEHFALQVTQHGTDYMLRAYESTRLSIPDFFRANLMAQLGV